MLPRIFSFSRGRKGSVDAEPAVADASKSADTHVGVKVSSTGDAKFVLSSPRAPRIDLLGQNRAMRSPLSVQSAPSPYLEVQSPVRGNGFRGAGEWATTPGSRGVVGRRQAGSRASRRRAARERLHREEELRWIGPPPVVVTMEELLGLEPASKPSDQDSGEHGKLASVRSRLMDFRDKLPGSRRNVLLRNSFVRPPNTENAGAGGRAVAMRAPGVRKQLAARSSSSGWLVPSSLSRDKANSGKPIGNSGLSRMHSFLSRQKRVGSSPSMVPRSQQGKGALGSSDAKTGLGSSGSHLGITLGHELHGGADLSSPNLQSPEASMFLDRHDVARGSIGEEKILDKTGKSSNTAYVGGSIGSMAMGPTDINGDCDAIAPNLHPSLQVGERRSPMDLSTSSGKSDDKLYLEPSQFSDGAKSAGEVRGAVSLKGSTAAAKARWAKLRTVTAAANAFRRKTSEERIPRVVRMGGVAYDLDTTGIDGMVGLRGSLPFVRGVSDKDVHQLDMLVADQLQTPPDTPRGPVKRRIGI